MLRLRTLLPPETTKFYGWRKFLLTGTSVNYDTGGPGSAIGFDPSHIALRDIRMGIDSVMYYGRDMNAVIREFSMYERSGLSVTSLTGRYLPTLPLSVSLL